MIFNKTDWILILKRTFYLKEKLFRKYNSELSLNLRSYLQFIVYIKMERLFFLYPSSWWYRHTDLEFNTFEQKSRSFWLLPVHVQLHIWCVIQFFHVWVCRSKTTTTQYWTLDWKHRSGKRKNICMWVKKELRMRAAWVVTCNKFYLIYTGLQDPYIILLIVCDVWCFIESFLNHP